MTPAMKYGFPEYADSSSIYSKVATALGVNAQLTLRGNDNKGDICISYAKYQAVDVARTDLFALFQSGCWEGRLPNDEELIHVFGGRTAYYSNKKVFKMLNRFPLMEKWLAAAPDAPPNARVWKGVTPSIKNLDAILRVRPEPEPESSDRSVSPTPGPSKGKGKEKQKQMDMEKEQRRQEKKEQEGKEKKKDKKASKKKNRD